MDFFDTDIIQNSECVDELVEKIKKDRKNGIRPMIDRTAYVSPEPLPHREGGKIVLITKPKKEFLDKKVRRYE